MKEYSKHIETYSLDGGGRCSNNPFPEDANVPLAEDYLNKYWLTESEYLSRWKKIHQRIFNNIHICLPDLVFNSTFNLIALRGGRLFEKVDFLQLQKSLIEIGETHFVVIENTFDDKLFENTFGTYHELAFRMKYPTNISWEELNNGSFISSTIVEDMHKEFFVFSESGKWGKYAANDYKQPLDIIGFKPEYEAIFKNNFEQPSEEWEEIKEWLPPKYKDIIK